MLARRHGEMIAVAGGRNTAFIRSEPGSENITSVSLITRTCHCAVEARTQRAGRRSAERRRPAPVRSWLWVRRFDPGWAPYLLGDRHPRPAHHLDDGAALQSSKARSQLSGVAQPALVCRAGHVLVNDRDGRGCVRRGRGGDAEPAVRVRTERGQIDLGHARRPAGVCRPHVTELRPAHHKLAEADAFGHLREEAQRARQLEDFVGLGDAETVEKDVQLLVLQPPHVERPEDGDHLVSQRVPEIGRGVNVGHEEPANRHADTVDHSVLPRRDLAVDDVDVQHPRLDLAPRVGVEKDTPDVVRGLARRVVIDEGLLLKTEGASRCQVALVFGNALNAQVADEAVARVAHEDGGLVRPSEAGRFTLAIECTVVTSNLAEDTGRVCGHVVSGRKPQRQRVSRAPCRQSAIDRSTLCQRMARRVGSRASEVWSNGMRTPRAYRGSGATHLVPRE
eukprot:7376589-Prymnesium_polylepis.1